MLSPDGTPIAVVASLWAAIEAQIRFMALRPEFRGQGLGARMVEDLEQLARDEKVKRLVMNARQEAVEFYRRCGFLEVGEGPVSFGRIPHRQMIKSLSPMQTIQYRPEWCQDLTHPLVARVFPSARRWGAHHPLRWPDLPPQGQPGGQSQRPTTPCSPAASTASACWRAGVSSGCSSRRGWEGYRAGRGNISITGR